MNRRYYFIKIKLVSPLSLSSGMNENTDSDVLLDSRDKPYIPATSIAGVIGSDPDTKIKSRLYGSDTDGNYKKSRVIFYDAVYYDEENAVVSVRDSVALENKIGINGAKFDFEIIEPGICFISYIELDDSVSDDDEKLLLRQLAKLDQGVLRFGHKTTRGYGQVKIEEMYKKAFSDITDWLEFDMYDKACWNNADKVDLAAAFDKRDIIKLSLKLKSALSIRSYTTELPENIDGTAPDYKFLSLRNGDPVIPGTSWAGAFRERFKQFRGIEKTKALFGHVEQNTGKMQKSKITFSESVFFGGYEKKLITRNSIDRFSAATNDRALYSELTIYGGTTELIITVPSDTEKPDKAALFAVIADLHNGFLAIGGLTSVGRGLFEVTGLEMNGEDRTNDLTAYDFEKLSKEVQQ